MLTRKKQIAIGKARPEYHNYIREIPIEKRELAHPGTPDPRSTLSKRQFDKVLAKWRRALHSWDDLTDIGGRQPLSEGCGTWQLPTGQQQFGSTDGNTMGVRRSSGLPSTLGDPPPPIEARAVEQMLFQFEGRPGCVTTPGPKHTRELEITPDKQTCAWSCHTRPCHTTWQAEGSKVDATVAGSFPNSSSTPPASPKLRQFSNSPPDTRSPGVKTPQQVWQRSTPSSPFSVASWQERRR